MTSKGFNKEQWRAIYELAEAILDLPPQDRRAFLDSRGTTPEMANEVLDLAEQLAIQEDDEDESPSRAGSKVGRFELLEFLGSGSAGDVFSAHDPELHRTVAIKILKNTQTELPDANERFIREARTASTLNHPNIVTVHEIIRTDPHLAIVMEFVSGESLRKITGQAIAAGRLLTIAQQVAEALAAAHAEGVVHRDVKPENLMVTAGDHVKVLDFGLARLTSSDKITAPGLAAGTLRYMAPEHYHGAPLTAKTDVFALGLVLYELATGKHPFGQASSLEILHTIATEEITPPRKVHPAISREWSDLIVRMLSKHPDRRPSADEIVRLLGQMPVPSLARASPPVNSGRWTGRTRFLAATAMLLVLLSIGVIAWKRYAVPPGMIADRLTSQISENSVTAAAISPDGKYFAYANADGVFLQLIENHESTRLNSPDGFILDHLSWMPDGTKLIASGFAEATSQPAVWWLSVNGGPARPLRQDARWATPSPDGKRISFLGSDYSSIWTMNSSGEDARRIVDASPEDSFQLVLWSTNNRHLIAHRRHPPGLGAKGEQSSLLLTFDSFDSSTGAKIDSSDNVGIYAATTAGNGEILFLTGPSLGDEGRGILGSLRMDLTTGRFDGRMVLSSDSVQISANRFRELSATADGKRLAVVGQRIADPIFVADFHREGPRFMNFRRLTLDDGGNYPHGWTPDSKSVIFESERMGHGFDLFKQEISRRVPDTLTATPLRDEYLPQLTPDGKSILFASESRNPRKVSLRRISVDGGDSHEVPVDGGLDEFRCSSDRKGRCVLRKTIGTTEYLFYELDPIGGIGKELARIPWSLNMLGDWSISPDGRTLAVPSHDPRSAMVRLVHLDVKAGQNPVETIIIPMLTRLNMVTWTADGTGWFISIDTSVGRRMYFWDLHDAVVPLGPIQGWAVPAPDNTRVAFLNRIDAGNVWLITKGG